MSCFTGCLFYIHFKSLADPEIRKEGVEHSNDFQFLQYNQLKFSSIMEGALLQIMIDVFWRQNTCM